METSLRRATIRLAHANPSLREYLLPVLKRAEEEAAFDHPQAFKYLLGTLKSRLRGYTHDMVKRMVELTLGDRPKIPVKEVYQAAERLPKEIHEFRFDRPWVIAYIFKDMKSSDINRKALLSAIDAALPPGPTLSWNQFIPILRDRSIPDGLRKQAGDGSRTAASREELIEQIQTQAEAIVEVCNEDKAKGNMRVEITTSDVFIPYLRKIGDLVGALDRKIG